MRPIVIASSNRNKIAELKTVAVEFGLTLLSPAEAMDLHGLGEPPEVDEVGTTYRANALLKAEAFAEWSGLPSLGDDSGLEVSLLENRPGLYSARYGGGGLHSAERAARLVAELEEKLALTGSTDRSGRFRCYLVLVAPKLDGQHGEDRVDPNSREVERQVFEAEAILEGAILSEPRGTLGFGYDPIVLIDQLGCTLAELEFAETCRVGFRAVAARQLFSELARIPGL